MENIVIGRKQLLNIEKCIRDHVCDFSYTEHVCGNNKLVMLAKCIWCGKICGKQSYC